MALRLPPIVDGEPLFVCVECGLTSTTRAGLEAHNEGWLLQEEDGDTE